MNEDLLKEELRKERDLRQKLQKAYAELLLDLQSRGVSVPLPPSELGMDELLSSLKKPVDGKLAEHFRSKGNDAFKAKKYQEAIDFYTQGLEADPKNALLFFNRSGGYLCLQNFKAAYEDARRAVSIDSESVMALNRLGRTAVAVGEFKVAKDAYNSVLQIEPYNVVGIQGLLSVSKAEQGVLSSEEAELGAIPVPPKVEKEDGPDNYPDSYLRQDKAENEDESGDSGGPAASPAVYRQNSLEAEFLRVSSDLNPSAMSKEYVEKLKLKYEKFKSIRIQLRKQGLAPTPEAEKTRQSTIMKLTKSMQEIEDLLGINNKPQVGKGWSVERLTQAPRY